MAPTLSRQQRDRALLVRLPKTARTTAPWLHLSLDAPIAGHAIDGGDHGDGSSTPPCGLDLLPAPPSPDPAASDNATADYLLTSADTTPSSDPGMPNSNELADQRLLLTSTPPISTNS